ncbi:MAG: universal stress protein A [Pseudohongiellaceae bacterium]|jgi:universal stress protein A
MGSYKKVLVAIDVSEEAEQVLQAAADIAEINQALISIIHVADNPVSSFSQWSDVVIPVTENQIRESLFAQLSTLVEGVGLSKSLISIDFGRAIDVIADKAESENIDLIVIGSHGRHGIKLLLGSTANGVLHHANCDVLAVRVRALIEQ